MIWIAVKDLTNGEGLVAKWKRDRGEGKRHPWSEIKVARMRRRFVGVEDGASLGKVGGKVALAAPSYVTCNESESSI